MPASLTLFLPLARFAGIIHAFYHLTTYSDPDETRLDATIFGPVCPQAYLSSSAGKAPGSNIETSVNAPPPGQRWPVVCGGCPF